MKIYYQNRLIEPRVEKKKAAPVPSLSNQNNRFKKEEKVDTILAYNPYATLNVVDADTYARNQDVKYMQDELIEYCLPTHRFQIEYFKVLNHDIYECEKRTLANIILTVTSKNEIFLWQENLMNVSQYSYFTLSYRVKCNLLVLIYSEDSDIHRSLIFALWTFHQLIQRDTQN